MDKVQYSTMKVSDRKKKFIQYFDKSFVDSGCV